jgi:hypothetical protein
MPNSDDRQRKVADLVNQVDNLMAEALKEDRLADVPDDSLGQLFASVLRLYAAKIESGNLIRTFPSGSGVTATDALASCTAILQAADISIFDLNHWQSMTTIGKHLPDEDENEGENEEPSE